MPAGGRGRSINPTTPVSRRTLERAGKMASTVVVTQPLKNASTPALRSRNTVFQSRQPTGPYCRRYASAASLSISSRSTWKEMKTGRMFGWYGKSMRCWNSEDMCDPAATSHVPSGTSRRAAEIAVDPDEVDRRRRPR